MCEFMMSLQLREKEQQNYLVFREGLPPTAQASGRENCSVIRSSSQSPGRNNAGARSGSPEEAFINT
jgi:hypothetical protein